MERIKVIKGDITTVQADAIVNAANSSLLGGGGVDGAIHRAGGPKILEECKEIVAAQGACPTGAAVITSGGKLPAEYVIHTVGPVWHGGDNGEAEALRQCYLNSLQLAVDNKCKTIAFPCISTGVYQFPQNRAARIAVNSVADFLEGDDLLREVILVSFDELNFRYLRSEIQIAWVDRNP